MAVSGMWGKMFVRNELLDDDHMLVLRGHREKNLNDVTVWSTYPPPAGWHSLVVCGRPFSPQTSQQTEVEPNLLITTDSDAPQLWF